MSAEDFASWHRSMPSDVPSPGRHCRCDERRPRPQRRHLALPAIYLALIVYSIIADDDASLAWLAVLSAVLWFLAELHIWTNRSG